MTDREKLMELLCKAHSKAIDEILLDDISYAKQLEIEADHLIQNGVTIQKWIPVTERLPEPGERVLTTDGTFVGEMYIDKHGKWRRYNVNDHLLLMALDILFWMPLPEPPKEEDQ